MLTRLTTRAPQKAAQKPATWKPRPSEPESELVSHSISPLTTSEKSPRVSRMKGNVRIFITGLMKAFTTPKMVATPKKGRGVPAYDTPGTSCVATQRATALTMSRMRKGR